MRGFHRENQCMKKTIDQMSKLLEHNNITFPQGAKKYEYGKQTNEHERCHVLKADFA